MLFMLLPLFFTYKRANGPQPVWNKWLSSFTQMIGTYFRLTSGADGLGRESLSAIIGAQETYTASDLTIAANAA